MHRLRLFFLLRHKSSFVDLWISPLIGLDVNSTWQSVRASLLLIVKEDWWIAFSFVCRLCLRIHLVLLCGSLLTSVHIRRAIVYELPSDESRELTPPSPDRGLRAWLPRDIISKGSATPEAAACAVVASGENALSSSSHLTPDCCAMRSGRMPLIGRSEIVWLFLQQGAWLGLRDFVRFERQSMMRTNPDGLDIDSSRVYSVLFFDFSFQNLRRTKLRLFVVAAIWGSFGDT